MKLTIAKPYAAAAAVGYPPAPPAVRTPPRPIPGFPCDFQQAGTPCTGTKERREIDAAPVSPSVQVEGRQAAGQELGLPGRDLLYPKYAIHNAAAFTVADNAAGGGISNHTVNTDVIHQNGLAMYDTHNLYGTSKFAISKSRSPANTSSDVCGFKKCYAKSTPGGKASDHYTKHVPRCWDESRTLAGR